MNLDDPSAAGIEFQTMNIVVAPDEFSAGNNFSVDEDRHDRSRAATAPLLARAGRRAGAQGRLRRADATAGHGAGALPALASVRRRHRFERGVELLQPAGRAGCSTGSPTSRTTANPLAGVWEVTVDARRSSDTDFAPVHADCVDPRRDGVAEPGHHRRARRSVCPIARSLHDHEHVRCVHRPRSRHTLGSAKLDDADDRQPRAAAVPRSPSRPARRRCARRSAAPSDPAADLDLFVYNCTTGTCVLAGQSADGDSEESVTIANPAAGTWLVLVDGFAVPAGTTTYNYVDVFVNPAFGSVAVTDANALRPAGASWTVPGSVTANARRRRAACCSATCGCGRTRTCWSARAT